MLPLPHAEEFLKHLPDEELVSWWGFMLATKRSTEERQMMFSQFAEVGMIVNDTKLDELLDSARDIMKREFNRRSIPLPS